MDSEGGNLGMIEHLCLLLWVGDCDCVLANGIAGKVKNKLGIEVEGSVSWGLVR